MPDDEAKLRKALKREAIKIVPLKPKSTKELDKILKAAKRAKRNK